MAKATLNTQLKPQEELFCRNYATCYNQTTAAVMAGYGRGKAKDGTTTVNRRSAATQASRMMQRADIRARVNELLTNAANEAGATPYWVAQKLKDVADRCLTDVRPVKKYDYAKGKLVETGEYVFNASGANRALLTLADIHGMRSETHKLGGLDGEGLQVTLTICGSDGKEISHET